MTYWSEYIAIEKSLYKLGKNFNQVLRLKSSNKGYESKKMNFIKYRKANSKIKSIIIKMPTLAVADTRSIPAEIPYA